MNKLAITDLNDPRHPDHPHVFDGKRFVAREAPLINPPLVIDDEQSDEQVGSMVVCPNLVENYGEKASKEAMGRLLRSYSGGTALTRLFLQVHEDGTEGMNLVHAWFGANIKIESHGHPAFGDCLYYVVAGAAVIGGKHYGPGSVFFVPEGKNYRVSAGPVGLEFLEFRVGRPYPDEPRHRTSEKAIASIAKLAESNERYKAQWRQPKHIGDVAFLQQAYDDVQEQASS